MERILQIDKFRNLGFKQRERLVLNTSLEKGKMGNLIVMVGANNSGKSNVLDALLSFGKQKIEDRDITTLSYEEEYRKPSLALVTKDAEEIYSYEITYGENTPKINYPADKKKNKAELVTYLNDIIAVLKPFKENLQQFIEIETKMSNKLTIEELLDLENQLNSIIEGTYNTRQYNSNDRNAWNTIVNELAIRVPKVRELVNRSSGKNNDLDRLNTLYEEKYSIKFFPNIISYTERKFTNNDLKVSYQYLDRSEFFTAILKAINVKKEEIINAYNTFNTTGNKGVLKDLENKLNKKLKTISKRFNDLYFLEEDAYKFTFDFESNQINFIMYRNGLSMTLDYQSTGFKWFFNLYFDFLCGKELNAGDIVVMDEPAINLHPAGQIELRKFLKEFAIRNDIVIILATHTPFLVDLDYLDEIRVVSINENEAVISNDFSTIDLEDPDSLKPIKQAFVIENHILYDPDKTLVFVEGITDYNYMVAFKHLFDENDIMFLPIKGVGKYNSDGFKEKQQAISVQLSKIKKNHPILMVDADGAGKSMKTINKDSNLDVFMLSEVNEQFKTIENLFSQDDLKTLGIIDENGRYVKKSSTSASLKTHIMTANLSDETKNNFAKLFKFINESL